MQRVGVSYVAPAHNSSFFDQRTETEKDSILLKALKCGSQKVCGTCCDGPCGDDMPVRQDDSLILVDNKSRGVAVVGAQSIQGPRAETEEEKDRGVRVRSFFDGTIDSGKANIKAYTRMTTMAGMAASKAFCQVGLRVSCGRRAPPAAVDGPGSTTTSSRAVIGTAVEASLTFRGLEGGCFESPGSDT